MFGGANCDMSRMAPKQMREVIDHRLTVGGVEINLPKPCPGSCGILLDVVATPEDRNRVGVRLPEHVERGEAQE
ncbi:MAG: hypothetical protein EBT09_03775 [Actinobacteria bacterium]|nr:hypothetical protein [Actinomycetota bacterium]